MSACLYGGNDIGLKRDSNGARNGAVFYVRIARVSMFGIMSA